MADARPAVLVTGAAGYVAMNILQQLNTSGRYRLRGTVRSLQDAAKLAPLRRLLPDVQLFEADLLGGPEAFAEALEGCEALVHCAMPFKNRVADAAGELLEPCVKGTEAVLSAALRTGVRRVVLTSSTAAVGPPLSWMRGGEAADVGKVFSEADWNLEATLEDAPYMFAKRVAEERAWEMVAASDGLSLTTICPGFVLGPMLSPRPDGESVAFIRNMLDGSTKGRGCKGAPLAISDVRDVALAHERALESPAAANKRFVVCSGKGYSKIELAGMISGLFPEYAIPTEGPVADYSPRYDTSKMQDILQLELRPVATSMQDMARSAIEQGIARPQAA